MAGARLSGLHRRCGARRTLLAMPDDAAGPAFFFDRAVPDGVAELVHGRAVVDRAGRRRSAPRRCGDRRKPPLGRRGDGPRAAAARHLPHRGRVRHRRRGGGDGSRHRRVLRAGRADGVDGRAHHRPPAGGDQGHQRVGEPLVDRAECAARHRARRPDARSVRVRSHRPSCRRGRRGRSAWSRSPTTPSSTSARAGRHARRRRRAVAPIRRGHPPRAGDAVDPSTSSMRPRWRRCRPGSFLVNCARGSLVDHDALLDALDRGHLAGAGLDVTEPEPLPADHPLRRHPRVVITPHIASHTAVGRLRLYRHAIDNALAVLAGERGSPRARAVRCRRGARRDDAARALGRPGRRRSGRGWRSPRSSPPRRPHAPASTTCAPTCSTARWTTPTPSACSRRSCSPARRRSPGCRGTNPVSSARSSTPVPKPSSCRWSTPPNRRRPPSVPARYPPLGARSFGPTVAGAAIEQLRRHAPTTSSPSSR